MVPEFMILDLNPDGDNGAEPIPGALNVNLTQGS